MMETETRERFARIEAEAAGEKTLTRHIFDKLSANTDLLLELRQDILGMRSEILEMRRDVSVLGDRVALMQAQLTSLDGKLASIVGDTIREMRKAERE